MEVVHSRERGKSRINNWKLMGEMAELEVKLREEEKRGSDSRKEVRSLQRTIQKMEQILG